MVNEHSQLTDTTNASNTLNNVQLSHDHDHQHPHQPHISAHTKRLLNSRHISMISIGGIIGTGLFMGIRQTLTNGPIISIISYLYISALCYYMITAVGEMSCYMPLNGSLCQFQFRFISNPVGLMNNFVYWISWSITLGLELSLIYELLCQFMSFSSTNMLFFIPYWLKDKTSVILIVWMALTVANLFPVNYYGEIEFIVTIVKVGFMISWIGLSLCLVITKIGFTNWSNIDVIWGINTIEVVDNRVVNKLVNVLSSSIVSSCFTFQSIESVGICSGEIENISQSLPKAIKYIVIRIVVFYIGSLTLLTLMIPSDDPHLIEDGGNQDSVLSSPFVVALINLGIAETSFLIHIVNFVILTSMISAANSNIYFGSRCLLSMVEEGYFWRKFANTTSNGGVPVYAIMLTSSIGLIISLLSNFKSAKIFLTLSINLSATSGLLMWLFISISYLRFRKALEYNNINYYDLAYTSPFCIPMKHGSWVSIVSIVVIILSNGITNVWQFSWDSFASCYLTSIVVVVGVLYYSRKWNESVLRPAEDIDIHTGQSQSAFK
ncbi:Lyp1 permease [Candida orthopsilosis Co 90-125]|uniref:Lyp1 permease n=1 Tax=Candida orthopsilosis (strain 90-125) TaxID=1136231 RepID=H8X592_CANO9|nr:Lyp1 permease [Candida orthopsilosis Co 90-125]CCG23185.1 Lyp1 permease [Candida orthopsilosis Co 90-125]